MFSASYRKGNKRVRILMQFNASRAGAISESGNEGWFRRTTSLDVMASINVSRFANEVSRVRRISAEENKEKTSSADSGSSQNYSIIALGPS